MGNTPLPGRQKSKGTRPSAEPQRPANGSADRPAPDRRGGFVTAWLIPNATVFYASGCIMATELIAGRFIARYLGVSLYTWTSVIGVVLAGISLGNYLGGRLADRYRAIQTLALFFAVSALTCLAVPQLNDLAGGWSLLIERDWPMRIALHVTIVFLVPSTMLGTISPIVAKMALDQGRRVGRTVGNVYAAGAVGSILGTFLTGFSLIAAFDLLTIIYGIAAALIAAAVGYVVMALARGATASLTPVVDVTSPTAPGDSTPRREVPAG